VSLVALDLFAVAAAASVNDELAKRAARAAAGQPSQAQAITAVQSVRDQFPVAGMIQSIDELTIAQYNPSHGGGVRIHSRLTLVLPVPVPLVSGLSTLSIQAEDEEPIVAIEAQADPAIQAAAVPAPGS
jgi:hypothetical protein